MAVIEELVIALGYKTDTEDLDKAAKKARASAKEAEEAYRRASKAVEKAQDAVHNASDRVSKKVARDALYAARKTAKAAKESMREATVAAQQAEQASKEAADAAARRARKVSDSWQKAWKTAGFAVAGFATAAGVGLGKLVLDTAAYADRVAKLSKTLGDTEGRLQALAYAGEISGLSLDEMALGVKTFNKNLLDALTKGVGPASEGFEILGLQAESFTKLNIEDRLKVLADALLQVEDAQDRAAVAGKLFGERSGSKLLVLLNEGSAGIGRLTSEAERYGYVLDTQTLASAEEFADSMLRLKSQAKGTAGQIGGVLIPVIDETTKSISAWVEENDEFIKQDLPRVIEGSIAAFSVLAETIQGIIELISNASRAFEDLLMRMNRAAGKRSTKQQLLQAVPFIGPLLALDPGEIPEEPPTRFRGAARPGETREVFEQRRAHEIAQIEEQERLAREAPFVGPVLPKRKIRLRKGMLLKSPGKSEAEKDLAEALVQLRTTGLEEEIQALGLQTQASERAVQRALEAAAKRSIEGASRGVQLEAARGALTKLTGQKFEAGTDPLLSSLFGDDRLPDVPISDLSQKQQPQVLISTINNTFTISVTNQIDGARDPAAVGGDIEQRFRALFDREIAATSKMVKVNFAR